MLQRLLRRSKAGKIEYRLDKTNIIHCPIGKASFGDAKLLENFNALMGAVIKAKPSAAKGQYSEKRCNSFYYGTWNKDQSG